jgi:hypothetical protein
MMMNWSADVLEVSFEVGAPFVVEFLFWKHYFRSCPVIPVDEEGCFSLLQLGTNEVWWDQGT